MQRYIETVKTAYRNLNKTIYPSFGYIGLFIYFLLYIQYIFLLFMHILNY